LQQSKHDTDTNNGELNKVNVRIIATYEVMIKLLKDELREELNLQLEESRTCWTTISMELDGHHPASSSITDIFGCRSGFIILILNFSQLEMNAICVTTKNSWGRVLHRRMVIVIHISDLSDLTLDDLEIIRQYHPIVLEISKMPEREYEDRLVSIVQHNPSIKSLDVECDMKLFTAVINLVKTTRENMLKGGSCPELHTLKLHDSKKGVDGFENRVEVRFEGYDISATKLWCNQFGSADPGECDLIRQYGWSIKTLVVPGSFSDHHAKLLDESTEELSSGLEHLDITPTSLTAAGLDAMDRVINRSEDLTYIRLSLKDLRQEQQLEKALLVLVRYRDRVTSVYMSNWCEESCLTKIKRVLPDRSHFFRLTEFSVDCTNWDHGLNDIARQWIISMISAHHIPLKVLGVKVDFQPQDWEAVIKAVDLSKLEKLHLDDSSFSQEQLELLVDRIADSNISPLPLKLLDLKGSGVEKVDDTALVRATLARMKKFAPQVEIVGRYST